MGKESYYGLEDLGRPNPGRLVGVGLSEDAKSIRLITLMGGRSENSRNRFYKVYEDMNGHGDFVMTAIHDLSRPTGDPATTLYIAHRHRRGWHVASNGEQTEGISIGLALGCGFLKPQELYDHEGEKADCTTRITVAVLPAQRYAVIGKVVPDQDNKSLSVGQVFKIGEGRARNLEAGIYHFTTTYVGDGTTAANYQPPFRDYIPGNINEVADAIWEAFDPNTKSGLALKDVDVSTGEWKYAFRSIHPGR